MNYEDFVGKKINRLTIIGIEKEKKQYKNRDRLFPIVFFICCCDCGKIKKIKAYDVYYGKTKSCGCLSKETTSKVRKKHGVSNTRIYNIYSGIKQRCYNKKRKNYKNYGGRGIKICDEWLGYNGAKNFYNWAIKNGYADNLTIERIDVNGDYCPKNCKWITEKEQSRNKRNSLIVSFNGQKMCLSSACDISGLSFQIVSSRLRRGWDEKDLFIPKRESWSRRRKNFV